MAKVINEEVLNTSNNDKIKSIMSQSIKEQDKIKQYSIDIKPELDKKVKDELKNNIDTLTDQQIIDSFNYSKKFPEFQQLLSNKESNKLTNVLTPAEMREALINSDNNNTKFAATNNFVSSKYEDDKKTNDKFNKIMDALNQQNLPSDAQKSINDTLSQTPQIKDKLNILSKIDQVESINKTFKELANESVKTLPDEAIKSLFESMSNIDLQTIKDANPYLQCLNENKYNKNLCIDKLYDKNGNEIDVKSNVTAEVLQALMTMKPSSKGDNILESTKLSSINLNKNNNKCTIDDIPMQTYKDIMIAKGVEVFDLALSKENALKKKLVDSASQASDLKKEQENLANNGISNEELEKMLKNLQDKMNNTVNNLIYNQISNELYFTYIKFLDQLEIIASPEDIDKIKHMREIFNSKVAATKNQQDNTNNQISNKSSSKISFIQSSNKMSSLSLLRAEMGLVNTDSLSNIVKMPPNFLESNNFDEFNSYLLLKYKISQELSYAVTIDNLLHTAIKYKLIDGKQINNIKMDDLNYIQTLLKEE